MKQQEPVKEKGAGEKSIENSVKEAKDMIKKLDTDTIQIGDKPYDVPVEHLDELHDGAISLITESLAKSFDKEQPEGLNPKEFKGFVEDAKNKAENFIKEKETEIKKSDTKKTSEKLNANKDKLNQVFPHVEMPETRHDRFAAPLETSEEQNLLNAFSTREKADIVGELLKEQMEIPEDKKLKLEQLSSVIIALESITKDVKEHRTWGEYLRQQFTARTDIEIQGEASKIDQLILHLRKNGTKAILEGKTLDEFLSDKYFGEDTKNLLKDYGALKDFFNQAGELKDIKARDDLLKYQNTLVAFLRDRRDYATAQIVMEEILEEEFKKGREQIDNKDTDAKLRLRAIARINKSITEDVLAQWSEQGMDSGMQEEYRKELTEMEYKKLQNSYIAENLLGDKIKIEGSKGKIWEQYNDMLDPKGEYWNAKDETWDMIMDELIKNAPLIVVSGGVAGLAVKGVSMGARAVIAGTRLATIGTKLAEGGVMARKAYQIGKLGARATNLLIEGTVFEATHLGLQGELFFEQQDWVKRILWTSASLGAFKFAGKWGKGASEQVNKVIAGVLPKIGDKQLIKLISTLMVQGHAEVAAMLAVGAAQHANEGSLSEFGDNFWDELFHAYVAIGALKVSGKGVETATGKIFNPGGAKEVKKTDLVKYEKGDLESRKENLETKLQEQGVSKEDTVKILENKNNPSEIKLIEKILTTAIETKDPKTTDKILKILKKEFTLNEYKELGDKGVTGLAEKAGLTMNESVYLVKKITEATGKNIKNLITVDKTLGNKFKKFENPKNISLEAEAIRSKSKEEIQKLQSTIEKASTSEQVKEALKQENTKLETEILGQAWERLESIKPKEGDLSFADKKLIIQETMGYLGDYLAVLKTGGFKGAESITPEKLFSIIENNQRKLAYQTVVDQRDITGSDHGVMHILKGDMAHALVLADALNLTPQQRILMRQAIIDHDLGYASEAVKGKKETEFYGLTKDHPLFSTLAVETNKGTYIKFFGEKGYNALKDMILNHSTPRGIEPNKRPGLETVRDIIAVVDCLQVTSDLKMMGLFKHPALMVEMKKLSSILDLFKKGDITEADVSNQIISIKDKMIGMVKTSDAFSRKLKKSYTEALQTNMPTSAKGMEFMINRDFGAYIGGMGKIDYINGKTIAKFDVYESQQLIASLFGDKTATSSFSKAMGNFGLKENNTVEINGKQSIFSKEDFSKNLQVLKGGETIVIETPKGRFEFTKQTQIPEAIAKFQETLKKTHELETFIENLKNRTFKQNELKLEIELFSEKLQDMYMIKGGKEINANELLYTFKTKIKTGEAINQSALQKVLQDIYSKGYSKITKII